MSMVPRGIISRLSVLVLFGLGSIICQETDKLTIPDKPFDHQFQGYAILGEMPHCVMKCAILVLVLLRLLPLDPIRLDIVRIPLHFHQDFMDRRIEGREVIVLKLLERFCLGCLLSLLIIFLLIGILGNQGLSLLGADHGLECFFLVYVLVHLIHKF